MIMRFRPANIRLINRRSKLLRLLLALSSGKGKSSDNDKNSPHGLGRIDTVTPYQANAPIDLGSFVLNRYVTRIAVLVFDDPRGMRNRRVTDRRVRPLRQDPPKVAFFGKFDP